MTELAPSILSADFANLGRDVAAVEAQGVKWLHIDVMDGVFVPSISFGFPVIRSLRPVSGLIFDVHLMIREPIRYIRQFAEAGSDYITVHYEACDQLQQTIDEIHACGCKCGVSVNPGTPISCLESYLESIDMVLVMTVEPGFGGQKYIPETTEKIRAMRKRLDLLPQTVFLEVDGGINTGTIQTVLEAGADRIVCGSAVFSGCIEENVKKLRGAIRAYEEGHE